MTIQPVAPLHLLTVAEYLEIGEIELGYSELVEGRLLMSPSPEPRHNMAGSELWLQVKTQLPPHLRAVQDIDIDLGLAAPRAPGSVRRPDLIVTTTDALNRVDEEGGVIRASELCLVVEILSPGSVRTDQIVKRGEYADAGIPHYWIVDPGEPVELVTCRLAGEFGYADSGSVAGRFTAIEPFPLDLDLDALR
jgi:Uma2 family endonuclease